MAVVAVGNAASGSFDPATAKYPDLKTLSPRDLRFDRADVSANGSGVMHNVLRFSNTVVNQGDGPLEMRGTISPTTQDGTAMQRVYDASGGYTDVPVGRFYYHAVHSHYHYDDWGNYQLWPKAAYDQWIASGRQQGNPLDVGTKTTSCVMDEEFIKTLPGTPYPGVYPASGCQPVSGQLLEGISPGWGDTYDYYRFEQWIDLDQSSLPNGQYVLRSVTDPKNQVYESPNKSDTAKENAVDNEGITVFTVSGGQVVDSDKPSGTLSLNDVDPKTATATVTARVIGRDDTSGVTQFRLSNDGNTWATYTYTSDGSTPTSKSWDLTAAAYGGNNSDGTKTVYAQVKDGSGKWSDSFTDTIVLDRNLSAYATAVMADGPVSYWRLADAAGASASDVTGLNPGTYRNGVGTGSASLIPSDLNNKSAHFDGSNDSVGVPTSTSLGPTQKVSVEAWLKPDAIPASGSFASVVSKPDQYALQFNGPRLEFTIMQNGARKRAQAPAGAIVAGQTYHVVGTYDGANSRLYVNGSEVATLPLTGTVSTSQNDLTIGSWDGSAELLRGTIDDVAVYSTALSAARVRAHNDAGLGAGATTVNPPDNLVAIPSSSSRIDVQWGDNSANETRFELQRDTSSSFASPQTFTLAADTVKYADTTLAPGTTYYYRVRAANATSTSAWSTATSTSTPGLPSGYAGAVSTDNPVSFWRLGETAGTVAADQRSANAGTYVNGPGLGATSLLASDTANRSVAFDGLDDHVAVPDSASLDLTSPLTLEAWIKPTALPAAGGFASVLTKPDAYSIQFNGPRLELTVIQNGTKQRLQAPAGAVVAGQAYHVVATFDGTTRRLYLNGTEVASGALSGAASVSSAALFVGSWDGFSEFFKGTIDEVAVYGGALSATRVQNHYSVGSGAGSSPVAAPSGLTATTASTSQINLTWADNSSNETNFVLERDTSASFTAPTSVTLAANATSYSDTGLAPGSTYYYRVRARNATDVSAYSGTANATTLSTIAAPSGLGANAVSGTQINLSWTDNSSNETGFVVERDTSASFSSPASASVGAGVTSYSSTGLTPGATYYFRVKATNATDASGYSNTASTTTPNPVAAPSGLTAAAASSSQVNLAWTDNSNNETGFVVERDTSSSFVSPTAFTVGADVTSYSDTSASASTTYFYRVKGRNATDTSAPSNTATATTQAAPPPPTGYANTVAADSPTSYWRLGETSGTTAADVKGANAGTYFNGAVLGTASLLGSDTVNQAVRFDGSNDYVRVANSSSLQATAPLTLEAWIKPTALPAAGAFASVVTKPESYTLQFNGPRLELTIMQNGNRRRLQAPSGSVVAGTTYHVVGTYDGTTTRLYLNGAQVATASLAGGATSTTNPLYMGSWDGTREFFNGVIDEVAFYRTTLTAARVTAHWTAGK